MRSTILAVLSLAIWACPPAPAPPSPDSGDAAPPPVPPPLDAGASVYDRACSAIAAAGCEEGTKPTCAATMRHIAETRITPIDVEKCAVARTKADVRACGSIRCL